MKFLLCLIFTNVFFNTLLSQNNKQNSTYNFNENIKRFSEIRNNAQPAIVNKKKLVTYSANSEYCKSNTIEMQKFQKAKAYYGDEEIVFSQEDGIYVQYNNGTGRRKIVNVPTEVTIIMYPTWSLDGTKIAFALKRQDNKIVELWVANADGSSPINILILGPENTVYSSYISNISWHWGNEYLMFSYWYEQYTGDISPTEFYINATIHYTGADISYGSGPDLKYCAYEPRNGSVRYAYIRNGFLPNFTSSLGVINLDGGNDITWVSINQVSALSELAWNNENSIYTIINGHSDYPNKQLLLRLNRIGNSTTDKLLIISDSDSYLYSPTVSADRSKLYMNEVTSQGSGSLWLTTFDATGNVVANEQKGFGYFPDWRQTIPVIVQLPDKVVLESPINNSQDIGFADMFGLWVTFSWQTTKEAESYSIRIYNETRELIHSIDDIAETSIKLMVKQDEGYTWKVCAKNGSGEGEWSEIWRFNTIISSIKTEDSGIIEYSLMQNYPNPFNPTTTIGYSIQDKCNVSLMIFDQLGKAVTTLVNQLQPKGNYQIEFNASDIPSGIYFYRLSADEYVATKKFVLLK